MSKMLVGLRAVRTNFPELVHLTHPGPVPSSASRAVRAPRVGFQLWLMSISCKRAESWAPPPNLGVQNLPLDKK